MQWQKQPPRNGRKERQGRRLIERMGSIVDDIKASQLERWRQSERAFCCGECDALQGEEAEEEAEAEAVLMRRSKAKTFQLDNSRDEYGRRRTTR